MKDNIKYTKNEIIKAAENITKYQIADFFKHIILNIIIMN